jgi:hypothetical protein
MYRRWKGLKMFNVIWCSAAWQWYSFPNNFDICLEKANWYWIFYESIRAQFYHPHFSFYDYFLRSYGNLLKSAFFTAHPDNISFSLNHHFSGVFFIEKSIFCSTSSVMEEERESLTCNRLMLTQLRLERCDDELKWFNFFEPTRNEKFNWNKLKTLTCWD